MTQGWFTDQKEDNKILVREVGETTLHFLVIEM